MQFPVNLNLTGRRCLVVGGGRIALRKARQLLDCGADLTVIAPTILPDFENTPAALVRRAVRLDDIDGMRLVVTATGDAVVDQQVFDECERRGVWVNSADDPDRCSFTLPAVLRRGQVMVTTSTNGTSPALSAWLRDQLEAAIGPEFADIAEALAVERARVHAAGISSETIDWRPLIDALVTDHGVPSLELRPGALR